MSFGGDAATHMPPVFEPWMDDAACAQTDPDLFFAENGGWKDAKKICAGCPVAAQCLAYAVRVESRLRVDERHGVFGGLTARERRDLLRRRPSASHAANGQAGMIERARREGRPVKVWTPEEDARLRELFAAGLSDREIGRKLGASHYSVEKRRTRLRLLRKSWTRRGAA